MDLQKYFNLRPSRVGLLLKDMLFETLTPRYMIYVMCTLYNVHESLFLHLFTNQNLGKSEYNCITKVKKVKRAHIVKLPVQWIFIFCTRWCYAFVIQVKRVVMHTKLTNINFHNKGVSKNMKQFSN